MPLSEGKSRKTIEKNIRKLIDDEQDALFRKRAGKRAEPVKTPRR